MRKPRILIASSAEALKYAEALQHNLEHSAHVEIWTHGIIKAGEYTLDSLIEKLSDIDAGVVVFNPDDLLTTRGKKTQTTRDNVILELGLFIGRLGRRRTFVIRPRGVELAIPSDLLGLTALDFDPTHRNTIASLGPACSQIKDILQGRESSNIEIRTAAYFESFSEIFTRAFNTSSSLTTFFIHSRRWREMHDPEIRNFLGRAGTSITSILPNPKNRDLLKILHQRFSDGPFIPTFVLDAYRYFYELSVDYPGRVTIYAFDLHPTYSAYRFDDHTIVAMYPTFPKRQAVPTFEASTHGPLGSFVDNDIALIKNGKQPFTEKQLSLLLKMKGK